MADVLKGNFQTKKRVTTTPEKKDSLEDRFEREALKKLGGSIAFVSRKSIKWDVEEDGS